MYFDPIADGDTHQHKIHLKKGKEKKKRTEVNDTEKKKKDSVVCVLLCSSLFTQFVRA